jgi:uncharacterized protein YqjF (DUF2071 family)
MTFMTGRFRHIILFNYAVDPGLLAPYLPARTELDFHNGCSFISLVGLQALHLKVYGIPLYRKYAQVNLRFYVRRRIDDQSWRHGVVFIKQVVPHHLIAWAARRMYNERMAAHRLDWLFENKEQGGKLVEYGWHFQGQRYFIKAAFGKQPLFPIPTADQDFFVHRHWGYSARKDGGCLEYRFDHPAWEPQRALDAETMVSVGNFYGPPFSEVLGRRPDSVFGCSGSPVSLSRGRLLQPTHQPDISRLLSGQSCC